MKYPSVTINEIDMFKKYKALLSERHSVQPPVPKTFYQDIPGADGAADLSAVLSGRQTYERREITMNFQSEQAENRWPVIFSEILKAFHGKEGKIIFGDDTGYYYFGRMEVHNYERKWEIGKFTITINAEPYKYELLSSLEPWIWDSFNFMKGVIRSYGNLLVDGAKTLKIVGTERWVIPRFIVEGEIRVKFEGKSYELKEGTSKVYTISIKPGENILVFEGNGIVSVDYRGGVL